MSQVGRYNPGPYETPSDDGRVIAIGFAVAVGVHVAFGVLMFAPFLADARAWLFSRGQAERPAMVDGLKKPEMDKKNPEEKDKSGLEVRQNLRRALLPPPKLKPAEQQEDIRLGQDKGSDAPTVAWISYDSYQELIARQGKVLQPGQQSTMDPVKGAEMIANPVFGEGQPLPTGGPGAVSVVSPAPPANQMRPVAPAPMPVPEGRMMVPTPAPESPSMAARPVEKPPEKTTPTPPKPPEPMPIKAAPREVAVTPEEKPVVKGEEKPVEKAPPTEPVKVAEKATAASDGNRGEKADASKEAKRDVDPKVAVKETEQPKAQAGPGEKGIAGDLATGQTKDRSAMEKGPGIGPDQTASLESGKSKVDGVARTPEDGNIKGVAKPPTDPAHSTGKTGSETQEQARQATQGVKEAKGQDQPTTKPAQETVEAQATKPEQTDPMVVAMTKVPEAVPTPMAPSPPTAQPAPSQGQSAAQPTASGQGAGQPGAKPGAAGPQGMPNSKDKARDTSAPKTDRDSAPVSLTGDQTLQVQPGRVITGRGVEIKTFHPEFSIIAMISSVPNNPVCRVVFDKQGRVDSAEILKSSGYPNIDGPILSSLYRWEASGEELKKLNRPFSLTIEVILGGN
jgi:hypothetical protein